MCQWFLPGPVVYYQCGHKDEASYRHNIPDYAAPWKCAGALRHHPAVWCPYVDPRLGVSAPVLDWYKVCLRCSLEGVVPEEVEDKDLPILHDWDEIWKAVRDKEKAKRREDKSMHDSEEAGEASAEPDSTTGTK